MRRILIYFILYAGICCFVNEAYACTSAIIPGWASPDGRPLLWKHRDTDFLENSIAHFKGEKYSFVGLVNSASDGGEVWIGSNTAGFAIMNTASYCLKNDDVPASEMDREGRLMYRALEICASLADFEHYLDTLTRPMGVEANFGCIDAYGGAAYYETDNYGYFKRNVAAMAEGYCVVTNFSFSGKKERWKGYERYLTADSIFKRMKGESRVFRNIGPYVIMDSLSRSYEHALLGLDLAKHADYSGACPAGTAVDQDFIPRRSTSASVVVQGIKIGESPSGGVLWAALGYPACSVMIPVPVSDEDHVPGCMKGKGNMACSLSLHIKDRLIFRFGEMSNMERYMDLGNVFPFCLRGGSLLECARRAEKLIADIFTDICGKSAEGEWCWADYDDFACRLPGILLDAFGDFVSGSGEELGSACISK